MSYQLYEPSAQHGYLRTTLKDTITFEHL